MIQLRRSDMLATRGRLDGASTLVRVGSFLSDTYEIWVADYELGYQNGYKTAMAGKPYNTVGVTDAPGRSADAYKNGYGKGYPAGQYQKAKDNSEPLPPLDPSLGIDPAKPDMPPPPPSADELKLPPAPPPKLGDEPPPKPASATPWKALVGVSLALAVIYWFATGGLKVTWSS